MAMEAIKVGIPEGEDEAQAKALAALESAASEGSEVQAIQPADEGPDQAEQWAMIPQVFGGVLAMAMPELGEVYTPAACAQWGRAMVPVAEKYGWDSSSIMGPEVGLLLASVPFALGTFKAVKKARAESEQKRPEAVKQAEQKEPEEGAPFGGLGAIPGTGAG